MSPSARFADDVDRGRIARTARIAGNCRISGPNTRIGEGAVVQDSYLENAIVEDGAIVVDSMLMTREPVNRKQPGPGFGGKWAISADDAKICSGSTVKHSFLLNTSVGPRSQCDRCVIRDSSIGPFNRIEQLFSRAITSGSRVTILGPTDITGSWLGHHMLVDRMGFYNGLYSNDFYICEFNSERGGIDVVETIDLPHVSRYGRNLIDSGNSGNLKHIDGGVLGGLGPQAGPWHGTLGRGLSMKHSPLCFVSGWTKVVGKSGRSHKSVSELLENPLATYLMPFSVSGLRSDQVLGQVITGELNNGYSYKERIPAWTFSYAPEIVIHAVRRLREAGVDRDVADSVATHALRNALAILRLYARQRNIDPETLRRGASGKGWKGWLTRAAELYTFHLESGLWEFEDGAPTAWRQRGGKWIPKDESLLLSVVPDAIENQVTETAILDCAEPELEKEPGVRIEELEPTLHPAFVGPEARVAPSASIGPGVQILGSSVIGERVSLYRTVVNNSAIGDDVSLQRSAIEDSRIGDKVAGAGLLVRSSTLGSGITADFARVENSDIAPGTELFPFAAVENSSVRQVSKIGTTIRNSDIATSLMALHAPGYVEHMRAEPVSVAVGGTTRVLRAIPMLGGGARARGTAANPVRAACAFVGSNGLIEAGGSISFGCIVFGAVTGREGLPPLTIHTGAPERDLICAAGVNFANIVMTHFLEWTYHMCAPDELPAFADMMNSMLREGRDAVRAELDRRGTNAGPGNNPRPARYKSLALYTPAQLEEGLKTCESQLADGRWNMSYIDGEMRFVGPGKWIVANGVARWE